MHCCFVLLHTHAHGRTHTRTHIPTHPPTHTHHNQYMQMKATKVRQLLIGRRRELLITKPTNCHSLLAVSCFTAFGRCVRRDDVNTYSHRKHLYKHAQKHHILTSVSILADTYTYTRTNTRTNTHTHTHTMPCQTM